MAPVVLTSLPQKCNKVNKPKEAISDVMKEITKPEPSDKIRIDLIIQKCIKVVLL